MFSTVFGGGYWSLATSSNLAVTDFLFKVANICSQAHYLAKYIEGEEGSDLIYRTPCVVSTWTPCIALSKRSRIWHKRSFLLHCCPNFCLSQVQFLQLVTGVNGHREQLLLLVSKLLKNHVYKGVCFLSLL